MGAPAKGGIVLWGRVLQSKTLAVIGVWSEAVLCPACCAVTETAGLDGFSSVLRRHRAEMHTATPSHAATGLRRDRERPVAMRAPYFNRSWTKNRGCRDHSGDLVIWVTRSLALNSLPAFFGSTSQNPRMTSARAAQARGERLSPRSSIPQTMPAKVWE